MDTAADKSRGPRNQANDANQHRPPVSAALVRGAGRIGVDKELSQDGDENDRANRPETDEPEDREVAAKIIFAEHGPGPSAREADDRGQPNTRRPPAETR